MLTLAFLFRRAPWPLKYIALIVVLIVGVSSVVRTIKATHQYQERNSRVHTHRNTR